MSKVQTAKWFKRQARLTDCEDACRGVEFMGDPDGAKGEAE